MVLALRDANEPNRLLLQLGILRTVVENTKPESETRTSERRERRESEGNGYIHSVHVHYWTIHSQTFRFLSKNLWFAWHRVSLCVAGKWIELPLCSWYLTAAETTHTHTYTDYDGNDIARKHVKCQTNCRFCLWNGIQTPQEVTYGWRKAKWTQF